MIRQYTLWNAALFSTIIPRHRLLCFYHFLRHHILSLHSSPHAYSVDPTLKLRPKLPIKPLDTKVKNVCLGYELHSTNLYQRETEISYGSESSPMYCPLVLLGKIGWKQRKFWKVHVAERCSYAADERSRSATTSRLNKDAAVCSTREQYTNIPLPTSQKTACPLQISG
jgi:hypothetical protein